MLCHGQVQAVWDSEVQGNLPHRPVSYTHLDVYKRQEVAREALRLAMHKLPCKCKIVSREDLEGGDNSEN